MRDTDVMTEAWNIDISYKNEALQLNCLKTVVKHV